MYRFQRKVGNSLNSIFLNIWRFQLSTRGTICFQEKTFCTAKFSSQIFIVVSPAEFRHYSFSSINSEVLLVKRSAKPDVFTAHFNLFIDVSMKLFENKSLVCHLQCNQTWEQNWVHLSTWTPSMMKQKCRFAVKWRIMMPDISLFNLFSFMELWSELHFL